MDHERIKIELRQLALAFACALPLAAASASADAADAPRIRAVRHHAHAQFERIVLDLDRRADVEWLPSAPERLELLVHAEPRRDAQRAGSALAIERVAGGARVSGETGERPVRVFLLSGPPRLVIDLGTPGVTPFAAPDDAATVLARAEPPGPPEAPEPGPVAAEPEPGPAEEPEPAPVAEAPEARPGPEPAPVAAEAEPGASEPAPPPEPTVTLGPAPRPFPAPLHPEPASPVAAGPQPAPVPPVSAEPEPEPRPEPEPAPPVTPEPAPPPRAEPSAGAGRVVPWLAGLLALGVLAGAFAALRRERRAVPVAAAPRSPDLPAPASTDITPEDLVPRGDRLDALEKRLDEETRERFELESRLTEMYEEQKVMRDRLRRLARTRRS